MTVTCGGGAGARAGVLQKTGDVPSKPSAGKHARWPQFCESRPVQLAATKGAPVLVLPVLSDMN